MRPCDNPFRASCMDALEYRLRGTTWDALLSRLRSLDYRAAIVGPHGVGKSTLLRRMAKKLESTGKSTRLIQARSTHTDFSAGYFQTALGEVNASTMVLFDSAERLNPRQWKTLQTCAAGFGGLVITVHRPHRLPTLIECAPTIDTLDTLVETLAPNHADDLRPYAHARYHHHSGNIRNVLRDCYDHLAEANRATA